MENKLYVIDVVPPINKYYSIWYYFVFDSFNLFPPHQLFMNDSRL